LIENIINFTPEVHENEQSNVSGKMQVLIFSLSTQQCKNQYIVRDWENLWLELGDISLNTLAQYLLSNTLNTKSWFTF